MSENTGFFKEFDSLDEEKWKQAVEKSLEKSGIPFEHQIDGLSTKAFYTKKDTSSFNSNGSSTINQAPWLITAQINKRENLSGYCTEYGARLIRNWNQDQKTVEIESSHHCELYKVVDGSESDQNYEVGEVYEISGTAINNSGAIPETQCAALLSLANELLEKNVDPNNIQIHLPSGSNFFQEIAKFRAFRRLWDLLLKGHCLPSSDLKLHSSGNNWTRGHQDPENHMIRESLECMSAIIGGCTSYHVDAEHFGAIRDDRKWTLRMGLNIQNLLAKESFLDLVSDSSKGSFYIETITDEIGKNAWELFRKINSEGGFYQSIKSGVLNSRIKKEASETLNKFNSGELKLVGINFQCPQGSDNLSISIKDSLIPQLILN